VSREKIYRSVFWIGYIIVFVGAFVPIKKDLHNVNFNIVTFNFHLDQILHAAVYFLICMFFLIGQYLGLALFNRNAFQKFLLAVFFLASLTEVLQLSIPTRAFNLYDWIANIIGLVFGVILVRIMWTKEKAKM